MGKVSSEGIHHPVQPQATVEKKREKMGPVDTFL